MSGANDIAWWGSLDPYTFGVWLSEDKIFDLPNPREVDRLLLLSFLQPAGNQHCEYINQLNSLEDKVTAYTAFTAFVHEWRHWYDFTSTPFGIHRMAQLTACFSTISQVIDDIKSLKNIYIPLYKWVDNENLIKYVHNDIDVLPEHIRKIINHGHAVLKKADLPLKAFKQIMDTKVSTVQILEGLAMLTQEKAVMQAFGETAMSAVRNSILKAEGGESYYRAINLLKTKAQLPLDCQVNILEATLFGNYGIYGSESEFTPPMLFEEFLDRLDFTSVERVEKSLDKTLKEIQGFNRWDAFNHTFRKTNELLQLIQMSSEDGGVGASLRFRIQKAIRSATLLGGGARYRDQMREITDALPLDNPYSFPPPLYVEGNPGRYDPMPSSHIRTLAGGITSGEFLEEISLKGVHPLDKPDKDAPYKLSVVWTPQPDNNIPDYYGVFDIFSELMYLRGVLFGRNSMSPITFHFTVEREAKKLGQTLFD